jgi:hypothetical protein
MRECVLDVRNHDGLFNWYIVKEMQKGEIEGYMKREGEEVTLKGFQMACYDFN